MYGHCTSQLGKLRTEIFYFNTHNARVRKLPIMYMNSSIVIIICSVYLTEYVIL